MLAAALKIIAWVLSLFGKGSAQPAPTSAEDALRQARVLAAQAARDEQAVADARADIAAQQQEKVHEDAAADAAAAADARRVRSPGDVDTDPAGHWRD